MNASTDTAMKPAAPPGSTRIASDSVREKPDCVRPQAIAVAAPMMSRIDPERLAVSTSIGYRRFQSNWR